MLKWTHRDLNPGPLPCKGSALPVWATGPKMILQSEMYKLSYTRKILEMSIYKNVRRWSSRRFPYGYLVTTSPSLKNLDSNITTKNHILIQALFGWRDGRCVQGAGTYSPRNNDTRLLRIPASWERVTVLNPNYE